MSSAPLARPTNEEPILPPPKSVLRRWAPVIVGLILVVGAITFVTVYNLYPPSSSPAPAPTACEGADGLGTFHFLFIGGEPNVNSGINFNGSVPGPCVLVANGSHVFVTFQVSPQSPLNHSWVLIPANGTATSLPAFPGAGFSNATRFSGLAPGSQAEFSFWTNTTGSYRYICEVPGHYEAGMYGFFNVSAHPAPAVPVGDALPLPPSGHAGTPKAEVRGG
jgi:hypothetical protein